MPDGTIKVVNGRTLKQLEAERDRIIKRINAQREKEREEAKRRKAEERERRAKERLQEVDLSELSYDQLIEAAAQAKAHPEDLVPGTNEAYYEFIAQLHEMTPSDVYSTMMGSPPKVGTAA